MLSGLESFPLCDILQQKPSSSSCLSPHFLFENCSISSLQDWVIRYENLCFISTILLHFMYNVIVSYSQSIPCWVSTKICHVPPFCIFLYLASKQNLWILLILNILSSDMKHQGRCNRNNNSIKWKRVGLNQFIYVQEGEGICLCMIKINWWNF